MTATWEFHTQRRCHKTVVSGTFRNIPSTISNYLKHLQKKLRSTLDEAKTHIDILRRVPSCLLGSLLQN